VTGQIIYYIPGIYTNYWSFKDTLGAPWYFTVDCIAKWWDPTIQPCPIFQQTWAVKQKDESYDFIGIEASRLAAQDWINSAKDSETLAFIVPATMDETHSSRSYLWNQLLLIIGALSAIGMVGASALQEYQRLGKGLRKEDLPPSQLLQGVQWIKKGLSRENREVFIFHIKSNLAKGRRRVRSKYRQIHRKYYPAILFQYKKIQRQFSRKNRNKLLAQVRLIAAKSQLEWKEFRMGCLNHYHQVKESLSPVKRKETIEHMQKVVHRSCEDIRLKTVLEWKEFRMGCLGHYHRVKESFSPVKRKETLEHVQKVVCEQYDNTCVVLKKCAQQIRRQSESILEKGSKYLAKKAQKGILAKGRRLCKRQYKKILKWWQSKKP
jgi:hypothetical protein